MQEPLLVSFHGIRHSPTIEARVREKMQKLEHFHRNITSGRVSIELPNQKHQKGNLFQVRIELDVAGRVLVVDRVSGKREEHEDVNIAIRDAFDAMRRQLQDYVHLRRGEVKLHEEGPTYGHISSLFPEAGYGFLTSSDGRELYFHAHSVLNDAFAKLEVGYEVRYAEEEGEKGPQASTVVLGGKQTGKQAKQKAAPDGEAQGFAQADAEFGNTADAAESALSSEEEGAEAIGSPEKGEAGRPSKSARRQDHLYGDREAAGGGTEKAV